VASTRATAGLATVVCTPVTSRRAAGRG
jgi:hypothetical protein